MKNLPSKLSSVPDLCHAIYADDVTIWCSRGSPGTQERTLQDGLDIIQTHAQSIGLECSPEKLEYVVVVDQNRKETDLYRSLIRLNVDGREIPRRPHIRILGFIWQQDGKSTVWTTKTTKQIHLIYNMLRRITRHTHGLKEHELRKIVEATVYSRVLYALPYLTLTKTQYIKLETALRKCLRTELGVPTYAPNYLITATALHNSLEEKTEAHVASQYHRLTTSKQGRAILSTLGYPTVHLSPSQRTATPIPRHMNPTVDPGRRQSRALHLSTPPHDIYYTDAAFTDGISTTVTVGPKRETVRHHAHVPSATAAETQSIAEAILLQPHSTESITIRSDSQGALRDFSTNSVPAHIKHDLTSYMAAHPYLHVFLEWVPGHQGIAGNERAHALARANETPSNPEFWPPDYNPKEERAAHRKAQRQRLKDLRLSRRTLPPPTPNLTRREGTYVRQAQTFLPAVRPHNPPHYEPPRNPPLSGLWCLSRLQQHSLKLRPDPPSLSGRPHPLATTARTWAALIKEEAEATASSLFDGADLRVAEPNPEYGDTPYTLQPRGCGEVGEYIHITPGFLSGLNETTSKTYGSPGSGQRFSVRMRFTASSENGEPCRVYRGCGVSTRCNAEFYQNTRDPVESSVMFMPYVPGDHDRLVRLKSAATHFVRDVLPNGFLLGIVVFSSSATVTRRLTAVKDTSRVDMTTAINRLDADAAICIDCALKESVQDHDRLVRLKSAATHFVRDVLPNGFLLGIVVFSSSATVTRRLTAVKDTSRVDMTTAINRLDADAAICIDCALKESVQIATRTNVSVGFVLRDPMPSEESPLRNDRTFTGTYTAARSMVCPRRCGPYELRTNLCERIWCGTVNCFGDASLLKNLAKPKLGRVSLHHLTLKRSNPMHLSVGRPQVGPLPPRLPSVFLRVNVPGVCYPRERRDILRMTSGVGAYPTFVAIQVVTIWACHRSRTREDTWVLTAPRGRSLQLWTKTASNKSCHADE
ncbi:hypothetical protein HPB47_027759 [Ixodes persulcatus]|uniref:Uncharacterized protein n=1 Tax=Ixodes persulcatus TaxID=34615 RepID=A0AC60PVA6_IXOPE|nr:hypothetical protein HPB47_027759 [Ixodes persulcatus]